jgi:hypothetical protein
VPATQTTQEFGPDFSFSSPARADIFQSDYSWPRLSATFLHSLFIISAGRESSKVL